MPIQLRAKEHDDLHKSQLLGAEPQWWAEPLGGQGVFNGAFDFWKDSIPLGWEFHLANATASFTQQTGGVAGNYCIRGANSLANTRVGYIIQRAYMPVDEDRLYNLHGAFRGSAAGCTCYFGVECYDAAKVYLGDANILAAFAPGVAWVRGDGTIGPGGTDTWVANTRYARVYANLQYAVNQAAGAWVEFDDAYWRPEP